MSDFRSVADRVAAEIAAGRLAPGTRLPPQRDFAHASGIAVSTASRVYAELARRGLTVGEVGRGTYVRSDPHAPSPIPSEPEGATVDLQRTHSGLPEQEALLAAGVAALARPDAIRAALHHAGPAGTPGMRASAARFLARAGLDPDPAGILFCGNGRQAIAAALAALARPGERIGVEAMTYPVVKGIAARLGIALVPIPLDAEGLRPDALLRVHRATPLSGIYLQPALQNPLGTTMTAARRAGVAAALAEAGLVAIEDRVYGFLCDEAPLAPLAPDRTVVVDSFSKRVAPGLSLGLIASPVRLAERMASSVRTGGWSATAGALCIGQCWMAGDAVERLGLVKRADAAERQRLARAELRDLTVSGDPRAYHLWLELPETWRAESYAAAALRRGIAIIPASAFAVSPGHAPNAVRLALAAPARADLVRALAQLRALAFTADDEVVE